MTDHPFEPRSSTPHIVFIRKWLSVFFSYLTAEFKTQTLPENGLPKSAPPKQLSFSLHIARIVNIFDKPFFWGGIIFLGWLTVSPFTESLIPGFERLASLIEKIVGPAVVGYWTNWLAIKMLFHPRKPNLIWQGLIPSRRTMIIDQLVAGISANLFSPSIVASYLKANHSLDHLAAALEKTLTTPEFRSESRVLIKNLLSEYFIHPQTQIILEEALGEWFDQWKATSLIELPLELTKKAWQPVIIAKIISRLPELTESMDPMLNQFEESFQKAIQSFSSEPENYQPEIIILIEEGFRAVHIEEIIRQQLFKMDESQLEELLTGNVTTELTFLQTSGGLFGLFTGLAIALPWMRGLLILIGITLWMIYRKTTRSN